MINLTVYDNNEIDSDRQKALATARMINYAAGDASELGLKECSQLLYFTADLIKIKYNLDNRDMLLNAGSDDANHTSQDIPEKKQLTK
jgi:hypothetical protein